jgi:NADP-dependent aldehyde dehydrogenase
MTQSHSLGAVTGLGAQPARAAHGPADVETACAAAAAAFPAYGVLDRTTRAAFLEQVAEEIVGIGDVLIEAAMLESGLPRARLEGERARTVGQLRLFAEVVRSGAWQRLRIDPALPERQPSPRPDIRMRMIPVGPVAVFGASNFPLAFSTAGGDTASALAAGCPVVVKGHPAHPRTGELVAAAIARAVAAFGLPAGVFGHLVGPSNALGAALVQDPRIAAVGFTGSRAGGLALTRLAQAREVPIPVYAEMSSINPVLVLPSALKARGGALGAAYVNSLTMGAGQFCTNPGLVLVIAGEGLDEFLAAAVAAVNATPAQTMLTAGIGETYASGVAALASTEGVETLARGAAGDAAQGVAALFRTTAQAFVKSKTISREVFGASSIILVCQDEGELRSVLACLEGQLTATLHMDPADDVLAAELIPLLERTAGRILANGWPTGVEVCHAMIHGGPYPATSDPRTTSVGSMAIDRFLRPVSYQNLSLALLPPELRDDSRGDGIPRLIDGVLTL